MHSPAAERAMDKSPLQYELSLEQMIENEYPVPSYMADVFQKPAGWIEIPNLKADKPPKVYSIDCEMVCLSQPMLQDPQELMFLRSLVFDRRWERVDTGVCY